MMEEPRKPGQLPAASCSRRTVLGGLGAFAGIAGLAGFARPAQAISTKIGPIRTAAQYVQAVAIAGRHNSNALVDIAADWCGFCRIIDEEILPDPRIVEHLTNLALIKVDVTPMDDDSRVLLELLGAKGPPTMFIIETKTGRELSGTRSLGWFDVENLVARLRPFSQSKAGAGRPEKPKARPRKS
ncbi:thioredoxin domain-containing protein [Chelatococcus sp. GCM10030263]|uniref:thioredoxin domain-containing protein n=1 Tax=Chelatococcus sp. GCM10030263 TaxID=3273387 RepID=UPI00361CC5BA